MNPIILYALIGGLVLAAALANAEVLKRKILWLEAKLSFLKSSRWWRFLLVFIAVWISALLWPLMIPTAIRSVKELLKS